MIVVDSSAIVDAIVDHSAHGVAVRAAMSFDADWAMPGHGPSEVVSALRGLRLAGLSSGPEFRSHLDRLRQTEVRLFPLAPFLPRIGDLADNATVYDAAYLALAEELGVPLLTTDRKFGRVPGARAEIHLLSRS